ncbi:MAG TPA: nuclear transport factor 2 family protein [Vicinamibacterales bacterium]|nr:nuclear transport factor 2 family protein [Vicinamibacterales bacterium]
MNSRVVAAAALFTAALLAVVPTRAAQAPDEAGARVPLENYFKGHALGDGAYMRQAFHPDAKICSNNRDGKLACLTAEEFASRFTSGPAADEAKRTRTIERLEVTGDTAIAKLILDYPAARFTDYMSLMKVNGEWKIMNKVYFTERRQ